MRRSNSRGRKQPMTGCRVAMELDRKEWSWATRGRWVASAPPRAPGAGGDWQAPSDRRRDAHRCWKTWLDGPQQLLKHVMSLQLGYRTNPIFCSADGTYTVARDDRRFSQLTARSRNTRLRWCRSGRSGHRSITLPRDACGHASSASPNSPTALVVCVDNEVCLVRSW